MQCESEMFWRRLVNDDETVWKNNLKHQLKNETTSEKDLRIYCEQNRKFYFENISSSQEKCRKVFMPGVSFVIFTSRDVEATLTLILSRTTASVLILHIIAE